MVDERVERRVAVIMATDIVGYSRLMEADETSTLDAVKRLQASILSPNIAARGGRIVKLMGDGSLVVFSSAVEAVDCAISLQEELVSDQKDVVLDDRILFRIGINLADVVIEGDDLLGDGVNVAARLEASAEPGGICIADIVHRQLGAKCRLDFRDGGEIALKNIVRPVHVWHWGHAPMAGPSTSSPAARTSIAILPFENSSGAPDQDFFSDGITEDIIGGLARFRSLSVIAASSSFSFRGKAVGLREIGIKLGVTYLVEGSVRRSGERIRITAQLVEATSGKHLWSEHYDRSVTDIFAVQDEVTKMIVSTLVGQIESADVRQALRKPTTSLAAYEFYLRGLVHMRSYGADDNHQAHMMFGAALERDPQFALAHAYLALSMIALHGYANAPRDILDAALALARKAVLLDEGESGCERLLGLIHTNRRVRSGRAALSPGLPAQPQRCEHTGADGRVAGAARQDRGSDAMDRRRLPAQSVPAAMVQCYPWQRALYSRAIRRSGGGAERAAQSRPLHLRTPRRLLRAGGDAAATDEAKARLLRLCPDFSTEDFINRGLLLERPEQRELFRQGLLKAGLPE